MIQYTSPESQFSQGLGQLERLDTTQKAPKTIHVIILVPTSIMMNPNFKEAQMEYAQINSKYYCGIDLHSRSMYICIINQKGKSLFHKNLKNSVDDLKGVLSQYKSISVGVESTYNWYWVADACQEADIPFFLGHALYMRSIHVDKFKDDRRDCKKIADLIRVGLFPKAYVYPKEMRGTRDIIRRRQRQHHAWRRLYSFTTTLCSAMSNRSNEKSS